MRTVRICNECATPLAADAPEGLCPKCLVKAGLMNELSTVRRGTIVVTASQLLSEPTTPPAIAAPEPSQQFGGYRIIRPLGKGGMGAVYEAEEIESGRRVALKVLTHSLDSPEARKRFLREGRLAASVNHPNSVYIYGTEEIDGTPVITMELVSGGTLQARVKNGGALPIREAVDVTLQIIAGLEAAAAIGVLHRDIKPANCFIETDGTVKVGDFGLSISTLARAETNLTVTGAFLGTPAYASPEQLRGDELDVRSDIYAVGVTLYYLLTGKTPFRSDNMVKLLATVLEQPPESPAKLRPEIPKELANVVLRCLAKQKEQRFKSYEELREALLPFDSTAPVPAPRALRFCAFAVDGIIFFAPMVFTFMIVQAFVSSQERIARIDGWIPKGFFAGAMSYFAIAEGVWGASLGKAICGLRVVDPKRIAPGLPRAALRTLILFSVIYVCWSAREWLLPGYLLQASPGEPGFVLRIVAGLIGKFLPFFALFFTARGENGFAGLHDLASNTRVVRKKNLRARPVVLAADPTQPRNSDVLRPGWLNSGEPDGKIGLGCVLHGLSDYTQIIKQGAEDAARAESVSHETLPQVGPYHVLDPIEKTEGHELLLGFDTRLLRKVWIRKLPPGTPPLPPHRHALSRPARLRWLNGRRAVNDCWDAFEAPTGESLVQSLKPPQSWQTARHWLYDLADELAAGVKNRSLPAVLALDRIWITNEGRAKLLDFPAPGIEANGATELVPQTGAAPAQAEDCQAQMFLKQAASSAVQGRIVPIEEAGERPVAAVLPLHARAFLNALPNLSGLEQTVSHLGSLLNQAASISFARRAVLIAGCSLPVMVAMLLMLITVFLAVSQGFAKNPAMVPLYSCLGRVETLERSAQTEESKRERQAFEIYVAANFRDTLTNQFFWPKRGTGQAADKVRLKEFRTRMERILREHPTPSPTEIADATVVVKPFLDNIPPTDLTGRIFVHMWVAVVYGLGLIVAAPSIIAALLFRGGLLVYGLGIAFVTWDGSPASRWRLFVRSLVTWSPLLLFALLFRPVTPFMASALNAAVITFGVLAIGAAWSLAPSGRGLQDRITGVWLVPR